MAESALILEAIKNSYSTTVKGLYSLSHEFHALDENESFVLVQSTTALGASSYIDIQLNSPSSAYNLYIMQLCVNNSAGLSYIQLAEMTTASTMTASTNAALNFIQVNRNCTEAAVITAYRSPTNVSFTTNLLVIDRYCGSTGSAAFSGSPTVLSNDEFYLLKYNSTYVLRVTNLGGAGYCTVKLKIHEHQN